MTDTPGRPFFLVCWFCAVHAAATLPQALWEEGSKLVQRLCRPWCGGLRLALQQRLCSVMLDAGRRAEAMQGVGPAGG